MPISVPPVATNNAGSSPSAKAVESNDVERREASAICENVFIEGADTFVRGDRVRIQQVLLNLLTNAVKYNVHGGSVELSLEKMDEGLLKVIVKDTGTGLSEAQIRVLFDSYERAGAENSDVLGRGMGLAISKKLIELMGGEIGVTSTIGEGSCFWVSLPLSQTTI